MTGLAIHGDRQLQTDQSSWTYLVTIYEGRVEVIIVNTWTISLNFELQQAEMHKIENGLTGVAPPNT